MAEREMRRRTLTGARTLAPGVAQQPVNAFDWIVAEAACSEVCKDILGVRINPEHVTAVARIASECGVVYAFERLCVICERPESIESSSDTIRVTFRDGSRVEGAR